jgi:hypothetical protein
MSMDENARRRARQLLSAELDPALQNLEELIAKQERLLTNITANIHAVVKSSGDDVADSLEAIDDLRKPEFKEKLEGEMRGINDSLGRLGTRKSELGLLRPLTFAVQNISRTMKQVEFFKTCTEREEYFSMKLNEDQRLIRDAALELRQLVAVRDGIPSDIWKTMCRKFNQDTDPLMEFEARILEITELCIRDFVTCAMKNPALLVRCLQALRLSFIPSSSLGRHVEVQTERTIGGFTETQMDRAHQWMKDCIRRRVKTAGKMARANNREDEKVVGENSGSGSDSDSDGIVPEQAFLKQLDLLTTDLRIIFERVKPCFPPVFNVYAFCIPIYCGEFQTILDNLVKREGEHGWSDSSVTLTTVMRTIIWLRGMLDILLRQKQQDEDGGSKKLNSEEGTPPWSGLQITLQQVIDNHSNRVRAQMDQFVSQVAKKLWTDETNARIKLDTAAGMVYTREPQDVLFFLNNQIDVCRQAGMGKIDFYRVVVECFRELPRFGSLQFEYLVSQWDPQATESTEGVTISTLCAYVNDSEKVADDCLTLVDELEDAEDDCAPASVEDEVLCGCITKQFQRLEVARDNMCLLFSKYAKDVARQIGVRLLTEMASNEGETGEDLRRTLYTKTWVDPSYQGAVEVCDACRELLVDVWAWLPNKFLRSLVVLGLIESIVSMYTSEIVNPRPSKKKRNSLAAGLGTVGSSQRLFTESAEAMRASFERDTRIFINGFQDELRSGSFEGPALKSAGDISGAFQKITVLGAFFGLSVDESDANASFADTWADNALLVFKDCSDRSAILSRLVDRSSANLLKAASLRNLVKDKLGETTAT